MKKVAIISLYHNSQNYGGVLQAFALNKALEKMGYDAYQIDYIPDSKKRSKANAANKYLKSRGFLKLIPKVISSYKKRLYSKTKTKSLNNEFQKRRPLFDDFREKQIKHTEPCTSETIKSVTGEFDVFICGSDQIWKPSVVNDAYMLSFVEGNKAKCSYAASLSVDSLTIEEGKKYSEWLKGYNGISVREKQAIDLLSPLTAIPIKWVCDPTLLLTKEEWLSYAKPFNSQHYMFCYFLGDDVSHRKMAKRYAKENKLRIITLPNLQQVARKVDARFGDEKLYDVSPLDFVSYIAGADIVMTDSFHAVAFSLNLQTPFFVFERAAITSMNSRIESLLHMTNCDDRFVKECSSISSLPQSTTNWTDVQQALESQRKRSFEFLNECLIG